MARPTLKKLVELPGGGPARYATGTLRLVASVDPGGGGWGYTETVDVAGARRVLADATGLLTFTGVRPNSGAAPDAITNPAGTVYELTVTFPDHSRSDPEYLDVPDVAGDVWAQDILAAAPEALEPLASRIRTQIAQAVAAGSGLTASFNNLTGVLTLAAAPGAGVDASVPMAVTYQTTAVSGVAADGWYLHDGSVADFTARARPVWWHGTAAQIPAQGAGDTQFQTGDLAVIRTSTL